MTDTTAYVSPVPRHVETPEQAAEYLLESIDKRLARLEAVLARYEPLLDEVTRRMAGPMKWKR